MKRFASVIFFGCLLNAQTVPEFRDLFNGKDLTGFVNVNTAEDTWKARDGMLICSGHPIGVLRTVKQYENFVLHVEWMHMEAGGNSGVFAWSDARPDPRSRLPNGIEIQMLELEWPNLHKGNGVTPPLAYLAGSSTASSFCPSPEPRLFNPQIPRTRQAAQSVTPPYITNN